MSKRTDAGAGAPINEGALHVLRVLVGLAIFANHWSENRYDRLIPQTQLAIDFIFFIEGLLAAHMLTGKPGLSAGRAILDRFVKIYPIWVLALMIGFAGFVPTALAGENGWSVELLFGTTGLSLLFLPTFTAAAAGAVYPLNSPAWAIVVELVGFAALCLIWTRLTFWRLAAITTIACAMMLAMALAWYDTNMGWRDYAYVGGFPRMAFGFFGGVLIYEILRRWGRFVPRLSVLIAIAGFVAVQMLRIRLVGLPLLVTAVPLIVLLAAVATEPEWLKAVGRWSARYAMGIYLLGSPVLHLTRHAEHSLHIPETLASGILGFAISTLVLVAASVVIVRGLDEPIRRILSASVGGRAKPQTV